MARVSGTIVTVVEGDEPVWYALHLDEYEPIKDILIKAMDGNLGPTHHRWYEAKAVWGGKIFFHTQDVINILHATKEHCDAHDAWDELNERNRKKPWEAPGTGRENNLGLLRYDLTEKPATSHYSKTS